jgi:hypothetical protein
MRFYQIARERLGWEKFIMKNQIVTGVGCFAGPQTLIRVFRRILQSYTLGQFENLRMGGNAHDAMGANGTELLRTLMTGTAGWEQACSGESDGNLAERNITGFFLALKGQRMRLAVFTKGENRKPHRFSTYLDDFVELRRQRMN